MNTLHDGVKNNKFNEDIQTLFQTGNGGPQGRQMSGLNMAFYYS